MTLPGRETGNWLEYKRERALGRGARQTAAVGLALLRYQNVFEQHLAVHAVIAQRQCGCAFPTIRGHGQKSSDDVQIAVLRSHVALG